MADDEAIEREVLSRVGTTRRSFIKRLAVTTAFAVPVVTSFDIDDLLMSTADATALSCTTISTSFCP